MIFGRDKTDLERSLKRMAISHKNMYIGTMVHAFHYKFIIGKLRGYTTAKRWVGTDILKAKMSFLYRMQCHICNWFIDEHLFVATHLAVEFLNIFPGSAHKTGAIIGYDAEKYEKKFNILVYMPKRKVKYRVDSDWVYCNDVVKRLQHVTASLKINWIIVSTIPKNALYAMYSNINLLLRVMRHDGAPRMVKEAQMFGVDVIHMVDKRIRDIAVSKLVDEKYREWEKKNGIN